MSPNLSGLLPSAVDVFGGGARARGFAHACTPRVASASRENPYPIAVAQALMRSFARDG